ncbi:WhiB family transcriptional regulator [Streptomyces sp. NBC_00690]|uniref:WhiB family transcriptional regulator n=1 Tax=Streptomyces sp. NBC_00690 TaxID=2975808 RepID=UPI002E29CAF8|nr:WhiB family transcriptional regulator [Streptomyces sp. NBC_00690]
MNRSIVRTTYAPSADLPVNTDWRARGACATEDPELFFPIGTNGLAVLQTEEAKSVCRRCPVMDTCLTWALENGQEHGVWGGLGEDERRRLKRRAARGRSRDAA